VAVWTLVGRASRPGTGQGMYASGQVFAGGAVDEPGTVHVEGQRQHVGDRPDNGRQLRALRAGRHGQVGTQLPGR
jgi:hypothetical protein